ncbi:methyltransferase domain-containing protein [Vineibacter terrae]|uniref:Methyltransferase domain-containing protein n=1 Tax=Vineibacter terrae TaxID=2586908 RepID=A0A5C8PWC4_9HYPH|nr:methyltransferase domain-containing protein [Vineibacter terrae]TXL82159.1 methyltransferase domain-containing protein [Vineibacter terrae]
MNAPEGGRTPAEVYETLFVPALFRQWGPIVAGQAEIGDGDTVLDVACGTGVLARAAYERAGLHGKVVGLDANPDMLSVARRNHAQIDWHEGKAESLPFPDASFDAVVSQFGLMFFDDRPGALRQMMRVLRPGGRLAVAVWSALDRAPGYAALARLLGQLFGDSIADAFRAPFVLGDPGRLLALCRAAEIADAKVREHSGTVRFASIDALASAERACVWTLGGLLDDAQFADLLKHADIALRPYVTADGAVVFDMPALVVTARKQQ